MTRPKALSWAISKDHLPPDVQPHVPDDLEDGQLAFWWAAFAKGVSSVEGARPRYEPEHDYRMPPAIDMLKAAKVEDNYGDDPVEATADEIVGRVGVLMGCAMEMTERKVDQAVLDRVLFQDDEICKFRDGDAPLDERLIEAMVGKVLERNKLIDGDNW